MRRPRENVYICMYSAVNSAIDKESPRGRRGETICPSRRQFDGGISFRRQSGHMRQSMDPKLAADLRPSADGSAVRTFWWPAVAKLQADGVPIA